MGYLSKLRGVYMAAGGVLYQANELLTRFWKSSLRLVVPPNGAPCGVFTRTPRDRPLVCDGGREYVGGGAQNRAVNVA